MENGRGQEEILSAPAGGCLGRNIGYMGTTNGGVEQPKQQRNIQTTLLYWGIFQNTIFSLYIKWESIFLRKWRHFLDEENQLQKESI